MDRKDPMDHESSDLIASVRALSVAARRHPDSHPDHDDLIAYHERTLQAAEAEDVEEHLALCPDCARNALDLTALLEPDPLKDDDTPESDWPALREALEKEGLLGESLMTRWQSVARALRSPRFAYAVAAVFFVAAMMQWVWLAGIRPVPPQADIALVDLFPDDSTGFRDESGSQPITGTGPEDHFVLILNVFDPRTFPHYRIDILDPENAPIWSSDVAEASPEGNFTVLVSRKHLPAERYRIRLYGIEDTHPEPLADYTLRLKAPQKID